MKKTAEKNEKQRKVTTQPISSPVESGPRRTHGVLVNLSSEEKAALVKAAVAEGVGVSTFLRTTGLRRALEIQGSRGRLG